MSEPIVIVDANAVCWQVHATLNNLSFKGIQTGMAFGFLKQIIMLADLFESGRFAFVWDSRGSKRRDKYSWYKGKRKANKTPEEQNIYMDTLVCMAQLRKDIIPQIGFKNMFQISGFEGDDLIASLVMNNEGDFIVVSDDGDLYQLLEHCDLYLSRKKVRYTKNHFIKEFQINVEDWKDYKAINGCATDSVPGVPGFGKVRTLAHIKGEKLSNALTEKIESKEAEVIIKRNRWLTSLPLPGTPKLTLDFSDEGLSSESFVRVCKELGIRELLQPKNRNILDTYFFKRSRIGNLSANFVHGLRVR